mmetsp:Transcript_13636/g.39086  ORF Transcript_13636/g.39086 Transcript_13636/m.39086 type:complete len:503 (+) Transcript_13636:715-2223(+)
MVADALDDGDRARVAHAEALARAPGREEAAARRAVEARVAHNHRLGRLEPDLAPDRVDADAAAVHRLADVVVCVSAHLEIEPVEAGEAEGLARAALEDEVDRAAPAAVPVRLCDLAGDARGGGPVRVCDRRVDGHVLVRLDGSLDVLPREQLVVERVRLRPRVGHLRLPRAVVPHVGHLADVAEVEVGSLVQRPLALAQQVGAADDLVEGGVAEVREHLPRLLGDVDEEAEHVVRHAHELPAQRLLLRRDADGAVVCVADARDDAADRDHRDGAEAKLVGAEQRAHHHIVPRLEASVHAEHHAVAQVVEQQRLVRLGEPELPRPSRVLDRRERRGAGAAVCPRDLDHIRVGLCDAAGDGADADLPHELDGHLCLRVDLVQVVDELGQVLDRVDVVVRRRRDEHHPLLARADRGDVRVHLGAGQLAALARLCALRDLDLDLLGGHEVRGRHAEAARRHLLDLGRGDVAVLQPLEVRPARGVAVVVRVRDRRPARLVLAALARV